MLNPSESEVFNYMPLGVYTRTKHWKLSETTKQKMSKAKKGKQYASGKHWKVLNRKRKDYIKHQAGYYLIYMPEHPFADKRGYIFEHRYSLECQLSRFLSPEETTHHIDGNKKNNLSENLIIFPSNSEHLKYHYPKGKPVANNHL